MIIGIASAMTNLSNVFVILTTKESLFTNSEYATVVHSHHCAVQAFLSTSAIGGI